LSTEYHTFLSHNSIDKAAVEHLAHQLTKERINPWLDKWNLIPGNPWQEEIEQALENCATCCVFLSPSGVGPWQNAEMRAAINRRVTKGNFRVIPVLLPGAEREQRSQYPAFLTQTTWVEFRNTLEDQNAFRRLVAGIRGIAPGPDTDFALDQGIVPYRGLQIFDVEHAPFFFGREALTEWIIETLRSQLSQIQANRFLAIIGPSGSGKSSLVRAGVITALRQGMLSGSEKWPIVIFKPGPDPIESLAIALKRNEFIGADISDVGDLKRRLAKDIDRLHLQSRLSLSGQQAPKRLMVVVDQFEEVFALCQDERLRQAFINSILYAAADAIGQTIVLITMRADFYGRCAVYDDLSSSLSDHQILIGPMSDHELRDAIVRPAQLAGCEFESGLAEMLIQDVKGEAGSLPLLEYALAQLWDKREGRHLTLKAYISMGKLEGALEQRANEIYGSLNTSEQDICKQIFLRLTKPGEGTGDTKRRAYRNEIAYNGSTEKVIKILTDERLITTEGKTEEEESILEVSHEALIRGWSKLKKWIEENRDGLRIQARLIEVAREWDREGRTNPEDFVYRGARLFELEEWVNKYGAKLSDLEREFLDISINARDRQILIERGRKKRLLHLIGFSVLILGGVIGFWANQYKEMQRTNQQLVEIQLAKDKQVVRDDIFGALIAFSAAYGQEAYEKYGRGNFTQSVEENLFQEYVSVANSIALAQEELYKVTGMKQRAEVISSLNGEIYLRPRNNTRRFVALVAGTDNYDGGWPELRGAIKDAQSIHRKLIDAGYDSALLINPTKKDLMEEMLKLLNDAIKGCKREKKESTTQHLSRGVQLIEELNPCKNTAFFFYYSGHGFTQYGKSYLAMKDSKAGISGENFSLSDYISIEDIREFIAREIGIQIIITDVSRGNIATKKEAR
jgi:energy-coupling factor transporter ATP-binding protein EcfA2